MWTVYFLDGSIVSSDERSWRELSQPMTIAGATYDILIQPASEMFIRHSSGSPLLRMRAPAVDGVHFFHYLHGRINLMGTEFETVYRAIGYFIQDIRIVLETGPGWSTVRSEIGAPTFIHA